LPSQRYSCIRAPPPRRPGRQQQSRWTWRLGVWAVGPKPRVRRAQHPQHPQPQPQPQHPQYAALSRGCLLTPTALTQPRPLRAASPEAAAAQQQQQAAAASATSPLSSSSIRSIRSTTPRATRCLSRMSADADGAHAATASARRQSRGCGRSAAAASGRSLGDQPAQQQQHRQPAQQQQHRQPAQQQQHRQPAQQQQQHRQPARVAASVKQ
jgi:hypothetical protein